MGGTLQGLGLALKGFIRIGVGGLGAPAKAVATVADCPIDPGPQAYTVTSEVPRYMPYGQALG
jgi:hypothetical protein